MAASSNVYYNPNHILFQTKFKMVLRCLERPSASIGPVSHLYKFPSGSTGPQHLKF